MSLNIRKVEVIFLALLIDLLLGELPTRFHPVAWMGAIIARAERRAPRDSRLDSFVYGALIAGGGAVAMLGLGCLLQRVIIRLPRPLSRLAEAGVLQVTLSVRKLADTGSEVESALESGDLLEARRLVGWHLVSRDTSALSASQLAAATIESVAENTSDGIVAPLFFYTLGGLPAALAYRFLNTADSMLGYRDARREWLGKAPARLDDAANWAPARLTALFICLAALFTGDDTENARRVWRRDAGETASPNAGHPMSATAGALGVTLEKTGHYRLGSGQRSPNSGDIGRSVRLMCSATAVAAGVFALVTVVRALGRRS